MKVFPRIKSEKGQAMVELAIALPILLTLLCGILDFGWIYSNQYQTEYAAQAAARYAAINVLSASEPELANGATMRAVANLTVGNAEDATVQVNKSVGSVSVTVTRPVKCLTFVAGTVFGEAYVSTATSVASY